MKISVLRWRSSLFLFALFFIFSNQLISQTPKHEVRAVWISTASGDWPNTTKKAEQQRSLLEIFDAVTKNNLNTVFFQVRPRGNTYYQSDIEPWAGHLTGVTGKDPGWDPLQFAIDEAHNRGLELHAWFNVAKVWGLDTPPTHPDHLLQKHRPWVKQVEGEWWLDVGIPEARDYTVSLVRELAEKYDIDGIHFDFIRYPNDRFDDWESFRQWSEGVERNEWRRNNVTAFVRQSYAELQRIAPWIKVGSAPIGIYQSIIGAQSSFNGHSGVFQDSRSWLREGIHDYLAPQIYWSIGEQHEPYDPDFSFLAFDWARENYGRHVYAGIGIYRDHIKPETAEQIVISRKAGMNGQAFFRYGQLSSIAGQLKRVYKTPSLITAMEWKDSIPPYPPVNITMERIGTVKNLIRWEPDKRDSLKPARYAVYRSIHEPVNTQRAENLHAVLPGSQHSFLDELLSGNEEEYFYTVTALNRNWNESHTAAEKSETVAKNTVSSGPIAAMLVSQNYPEPFTASTYLCFSLARPESVAVKLIHRGTLQENILDYGMKKAGRHIIVLQAGELPSGEIDCEVIAGEQTEYIVVTKK